MGLLLYEESFVEQQPFLVFAAYRKDVQAIVVGVGTYPNKLFLLKTRKTLQIDSKKCGKMLKNSVKNVEKCYR